MSGADIERSYRQCMKREVDRERQRRKSKRYGNVRNMAHICDFAAAEAAEESPSWLSDNGAGVERTTAACDGETPETRHRQTLRNARRRLKRRHPELVEVFDLIIRNGRFRKESIFQLLTAAERRLPNLETTQAWNNARLQYWRSLHKLERIFGLKTQPMEDSAAGVSEG